MDDSNLRDLGDGRNNAAKMWANLQRSNQDSSSGGRMYWLRKLLLQRLTGTDVESHINVMQSIHDHLASLITPKNPPTADDILAKALLVSLPPDWILCVSSLLNKSRTSSTQIVTTLKAKVLRRKVASLHEPINLTAASAKTSTKLSKKPSTGGSKPSRCAFCDRTNHKTDNCWSLQDLKKDHSDSVSKHLKASIPDSKDGSRSSGGRAKRSEDTSRVAIVEDSDSEDEHSSSAVIESTSSVNTTSARWNLASHHSRTKNIHTRYHFVRECVDKGDVSIRHVSSADMLADLLTKPLEKTLLSRQRQMLGIL